MDTPAPRTADDTTTDPPAHPTTGQPRPAPADATAHPEAATAADEPDRPAGQARLCGYRQCRQPLDYDGRGRPPEYCPHRRWPDGRTCRQLAAADRAADRAAGMDAPLATFRDTSARLAELTGPLARQLTDLLAALDQVRDAALTRITAAEQAAHAAADRADAAEHAAEQARAAHDQAEQLRQQAEAAAAEAHQRTEAAQADADARIAQARHDADTQIQRAWQQVADADHARGRAEATAAAAADTAATETDRRKAAEQRAEDLHTELRTTRADRDQARQHLHRLRTACDQALARAQAAEADRDQLRRRYDELRTATSTRPRPRHQPGTGTLGGRRLRNAGARRR